MKRTLDIMMAVAGLVVLGIPMMLIAAAVKATSPGPVLYWSDRVGRDNRVFRMPKFRTMRIDTPELATHLLTDARFWITPLGRLLRKTSLDELPQLWSILTGDMRFVGPRPAMFNQDDLIAQRTQADVHRLVPGLTGWAQVCGRDELSIPEKVEYDRYYLEHQTVQFDLWILVLTLVKVLRQEGVRQANESSVHPRQRNAA